ncbi:hypothetical protein Glove_168g279 [Diversispora epigaea]|uniref:DUF659 domain-containing protein n=1 Tax=Diversispora epigaea TaxID=1348612 RepID=A0A397IUL1_9GLOM|nr:hypothetical protein Glove_168g279 [Diversispora epigaea]
MEETNETSKTSETSEQPKTKGKNIVSTKYPHIFPIRCIAHHINLLSSDIIKLNWATNIITCCKKIVTFFKQSHAGGAILQQEIVENMIKGGGLKKYVITRWT